MNSAAATVRQSGGRVEVAGPLTLETVPTLEQAVAALRPPFEVVDMQAVTAVDSAALAWLSLLVQRHHEAIGAESCTLTLLGAPAGLKTLAQLYELDFLHFAADS